MGDEIIVRCSRCEDIPVPFPGELSTKSTCSKCGRDVWIASSTLTGINRSYPGIPWKAVCVRCVDEHNAPLAFLVEQVDALRQVGDSDEVIAYKLAIADVAAGTASLEDAEAEIFAFPNGQRARAFPAALRRAALFVASTRSPPN